MLRVRLVFPMRLLEALIPRDVIGFCYHTVSDRPLAHVQGLYRCKSVAQFRRDLEFLGRSYRVIGYGDLSELRSSSRRERPRVIITFDDGLAECYDVIRPLLLEYGMPAIFFVTTGFLDNRKLFYRQKVALCIESYSRMSPDAQSAVRADIVRLFDSPSATASQSLVRLQSATWREEAAVDALCTRLGIDIEGFLREVRPYLTTAQVQALDADGFTIGAHGTEHHLLSTMPESCARDDIIFACDAVAALVGASVVPFAFPFNGLGVSRDMLMSLRESHPQVGLFFDSRQLAFDREFVINRLVVDDPKRAAASGSNLPASLRRAYAREIVRPLVSPRRSN